MIPSCLGGSNGKKKVSSPQKGLVWNRQTTRKVGQYSKKHITQEKERTALVWKRLKGGGLLRRVGTGRKKKKIRREKGKKGKRAQAVGTRP